jgi:hypothetical protein
VIRNCVILYFLTSKLLLGQENLVPNGGFDSIRHPLNISNVFRQEGAKNVPPWFLALNSRNFYLKNKKTDPGYERVFGVPFYHRDTFRNKEKFLNSKSGNGYAALAVFYDFTYIGVKLKRKATPNKVYFQRFYTVNVPDPFEIDSIHSNVFINTLSLFLSKDSILANRNSSSIQYLESDILYPKYPVRWGINWFTVSSFTRLNEPKEYLYIGGFNKNYKVEFDTISQIVNPPFTQNAIDEIGLYEFDPLPDTLIFCDKSKDTIDAKFLDAHRYEWSDGIFGNKRTFSSSGKYYLEISIDSTQAVDSVYVVVEKEFFDNFRLDTILCKGDKILVGLPPGNIEWDCCLAPNQREISLPGNYTGIFKGKCDDYSIQTNVEYEICDCEFYIPTAISPNRDGNNDSFKYYYECISPVIRDYISLFDRWGNMLYEGPFMNNEMLVNEAILLSKSNDGVLVYRLEIEYLLKGELKKVSKSGELTVVR